PPGTHGTTFGGGPLACRVALEFLSELEGIVDRVRETGRHLFDQIWLLQQKHPVITEIRGKGLMIGVELSCPGQPFVEQAAKLGLLINCTHETVLRLLPPFVLTSDQADEIVRLLDLALEYGILPIR